MSRIQSTQSHIARRICRAAAWLIAASPLSALAGLEVNPVFPAYGIPVALELNSVGPAPWVPATRYRLDGSSITLEMENNPGGYFGPRPDMGYMPVSIGEMAPGTYAVQARLYDMRDLDAPPRIYTHMLQVSAPEAPGVYAVPRVPGAYEALELVVRAEAPIDPSSLRVSVANDTVRVDFSYSTIPGAESFARVKLDGLPPGAYRAEAYGSNPSMWAPARPYSGNFGVASSLEFRLHPVKDIYGGPMFFDLKDAGAVLRFYRDFIADAPEQFGGFPAWQIAPPLPFIPEERHGETFLAFVACWAGPVGQGERALKPLHDVAPVVAEHVGPMPYPALNSAFDALYPPGLQHY